MDLEKLTRRFETKYRTRVVNRAIGKGVRSSDAEDIAQEVFMRYVENAEQLLVEQRRGAAFEIVKWIRVVTDRLCADWRKTQAKLIDKRGLAEERYKKRNRSRGGHTIKRSVEECQKPRVFAAFGFSRIAKDDKPAHYDGKPQ